LRQVHASVQAGRGVGLLRRPPAESLLRAFSVSPCLGGKSFS